MMALVNEIFDALDDLGYPTAKDLQEDAEALTKPTVFSSVASWLANQLQVVANLESSVSSVQSDDDWPYFQIEMNSLLRELNSPLTGASLDDKTNKLKILNCLCGELFASRILYVNGNDKTMNGKMEIEMGESETARCLRNILMAVGQGQPPKNAPPSVVFSKIKSELAKKFPQPEDSLFLPDGHVLSQKQWSELEQLEKQFINDYTLRREMLLRRCECTIGSFGWKTPDGQDKIKSDELNKILETLRKTGSKPTVSLIHGMAAKKSDGDPLLNSFVSDTHIDCLIKPPETTLKANRGAQQVIQQQLHKYIIGNVPDRGGRPNEQPAPQQETFSQQQQQRHGGQRGGHRGGRGGGGGGNYREQREPRQGGHQRVQGAGWSQNSDRYNARHAQDYQHSGHGQGYGHGNYQSGYGNDYYGQGSQQYGYGHQQHQYQYQQGYYDSNYQSQYDNRHHQGYGQRDNNYRGGNRRGGRR